MCNLYSMTATVDEMRRLFGPFAGETGNLPAFDEIYPGQLAPVLRRGADGRLRLDMMRWGFPGPAAAGSRPVTNVRNLASRERRCLVPATRFCEWEGERGSKRKAWFALAGPEPPLFALAGLWRPVADGATFAFLTCEANRTVGAVHPQAMPVMLAPADHARWLDDEQGQACALARPFADSAMRRIESAA